MGSIGFIGDMGFIQDIGSIGFIVDCLVKLPAALSTELPARVEFTVGMIARMPVVSGYEFRRDDPGENSRNGDDPYHSGTIGHLRKKIFFALSRGRRGI